jgi:hypothetical protein
MLRKRCYAELALAVLSMCLGVLTVVWPDWIEGLTDLEPDAHDGSAEWLIALGLGLVAATCFALARRDYRRALPTRG